MLKKQALRPKMPYFLGFWTKLFTAGIEVHYPVSPNMDSNTDLSLYISNLQKFEDHLCPDM